MASKVNTTKQLIDEYGISVLKIALETGASSRTVERWYVGKIKRATGGYQKSLEQMLEKEKRKAEKKGAAKNERDRIDEPGEGVPESSSGEV